MWKTVLRSVQFVRKKQSGSVLGVYSHSTAVKNAR